MNFRTSRDFKRIPIWQIAKNPNQPRKYFEQKALEELRDSIAQYGVISPLTVRREGESYELIAGERRLRASQMAGLATVPCYIIKAEELDSSLMALVENLQRKDLDFFEEAQSLRRLCEHYGLTQQQAAEKIGKTQSAVANKLRLLRLEPETVEIVRESGLTERHARALLRVEDGARQKSAAAHIVAKKLNVEKTDQYIDKLLSENTKSKQTNKIVFKDIRIFLNTLTKAITIMKGAGFGANMIKEQEGETVVLTIRIDSPADKNRKEKAVAIS